MRGPVLGLGGSNHDFSAAIVEDGAIRVAVEDERLQRVKQARTEWHSSPARDASTYCLDAAGLELDDLAGVFCCDDLERPTKWIDWDSVNFVNHHAAHAAASFFTSPFERAALLVVDGHGSPIRETEGSFEVETISIGAADANSLDLEALETGVRTKAASSWRYITGNSIGLFYGLISEALGFGDAGAGKTMGLAAYGSPTLLDALREHVSIEPGGRFLFDPYGGIWEWLTETIASSANATQVRADIAFAGQEIFVEAILSAATEAYKRAPASALCFGGGCALNTLANSRILEATPFEHVFVFPAAGDNGLAVGAAFYGAHVCQGQPRSIAFSGWRGRTVYTGRTYSTGEIDAALERASVVVRRSADVAKEASEALICGESVAMFRGGSEIGPRALGNRSLLALPHPVAMRDHINLNVKGRESFRPLVPVVPIEHLSTYFEGVEESPFMLLVATVRADVRNQLPAVTHVDGTARVQTVRQEDNPFLHRLLNLVGDSIGVPVLLNTSLNLRGEPIVEMPDDAVAMFLRCPIDMLVLEDRVARKHSPWATPSFIPSLARRWQPVEVFNHQLSAQGRS